MKREFLTVRGSVTVDDNEIRVRNLAPANRKNLYWLLFHFFFFSYIIEKGSKMKPLAMILLGILGLYALYLLGRNVLFTVWRNRIPLSEIRSVKLGPGEYGQLETIVHIELRNRRVKTLAFRTAEAQHQEFLELLNHSCGSVQPA